MRVAIAAADLAVGDTIAGVGKVTRVNNDGTAVRFALDWATVDDQVLSADHVVYVDRPDAA